MRQWPLCASGLPQHITSRLSCLADDVQVQLAQGGRRVEAKAEAVRLAVGAELLRRPLAPHLLCFVGWE